MTNTCLLVGRGGKARAVESHGQMWGHGGWGLQHVCACKQAYTVVYVSICTTVRWGSVVTLGRSKRSCISASFDLLPRLKGGGERSS